MRERRGYMPVDPSTEEIGAREEALEALKMLYGAVPDHKKLDYIDEYTIVAVFLSSVQPGIEVPRFPFPFTIDFTGDGEDGGGDEDEGPEGDEGEPATPNPEDMIGRPWTSGPEIPVDYDGSETVEDAIESARRNIGG